MSTVRKTVSRTVREAGPDRQQTTTRTVITTSTPVVQSQSRIPISTSRPASKASKLPIPKSAGASGGCCCAGKSRAPQSRPHTGTGVPESQQPSAKSKKTNKTVSEKKVEETPFGKRITTTITRTLRDPGKSSERDESVAAPPAGKGPLPKGAPPSVVEDEGPADRPSISLENVVSEQLLAKAAISPGGATRAKGTTAKETEIPVIMTDEGPVPATFKLTLDRTIERSTDVEYIKRFMTGVEADESSGPAKQFQYSIQELEPGGILGTSRQENILPLHEVISCKSSLTFAPGLKETVTTTIYETTDPDPIKLSELIEEEAREVDKMCTLPPPDVKGSHASIYGLKKIIQKIKLNPENVRRLESSIGPFPITADEPQEEIQPEIMAAIMHTEERGLSMESAPTNVYSYLFPDTKDELVIRTNPVAPRPLQNVVVPQTVPSELLISGITPELEYMAMGAADCLCRQPCADVFSNSIMKSGVKPKAKNTAAIGQGRVAAVPLLTAEEPPWKREDMQPVIDLVGAAPRSTITAVNLSDITPTVVHNEVDNVLEYHLIPKQPQYVSKVQLRGSQQPNWFPGYYMALPDSIKVVKSPCDVLPAAWAAVQPDIFSDDSFLIVG